MHRGRSERPADRHADDDQPRHAPSGIAQLPEIEAEAALEQDHRHGELHDRLQQGTEIAFRFDKTEGRACDQASDQHQCDRRKIGAPGHPLRADAEDTDHRDFYHQGVE